MPDVLKWNPSDQLAPFSTGRSGTGTIRGSRGTSRARQGLCKRVGRRFPWTGWDCPELLARIPGCVIVLLTAPRPMYATLLAVRSGAQHPGGTNCVHRGLDGDLLLISFHLCILDPTSPLCFLCCCLACRGKGRGTLLACQTTIRRRLWERNNNIYDYKHLVATRFLDRIPTGSTNTYVPTSAFCTRQPAINRPQNGKNGNTVQFAPVVARGVSLPECYCLVFLPLFSVATLPSPGASI